MIGTAVVFLLTSHGLSLATPNPNLGKTSDAALADPSAIEVLLRLENGKPVERSVVNTLAHQVDQQVAYLSTAAQDRGRYLVPPPIALSSPAPVRTATATENNLNSLLEVAKGLKVLLTRAQKGTLRRHDTRSLMWAITGRTRNVIPLRGRRGPKGPPTRRSPALMRAH